VLPERAEIPVNQTQPRCEPRQTRTRCGKGIGIAIDSDQNAVRAAPIQDARRMAALPDGTIEVRSSRLASQPRRHFHGENWNMADRADFF
jgi:hypothetical protein